MLYQTAPFRAHARRKEASAAGPSVHAALHCVCIAAATAWHLTLFRVRGEQGRFIRYNAGLRAAVGDEVGCQSSVTCCCVVRVVANNADR